MYTCLNFCNKVKKHRGPKKFSGEQCTKMIYHDYENTIKNLHVLHAGFFPV